MKGNLKLKLPTPANDNRRPIKLLAYGDLRARGITYTYRHLYNLEARGKFPIRVAIGDNRIGWIEAEIDNWLHARAALRYAA
ncbi:helix-turn-helix transcriptional regulator [Tardiphaga sp. 215_C5_N2_1]|uniref:helix-turn-helix transcriptional regulator n=1 Tax=Tardiphaga sp. 215_C5_N2_1 TaxID=3240774 RepID=UPI003F8BDC3C